jgi:acyl-CoA thioester hydrolase
MVQPVQWGEQDLFGHVNHVVYLRWLESARIEYLIKVGLMSPEGRGRIGPIMASVSNDYRRQLTYPDTVWIGVRVARIGRSSIQMEHKLLSQKDGLIAAEGSATIVVVDYETGKSHPVPVQFRQAIEALEGRAF